MTNFVSKQNVALATVLSMSGIAVGRMSVTVPIAKASPIALRWLNEGDNKPNRYAITVAIKIGKASGTREIVCATDGSSARLDGQPEGTNIDDADAKAICEDAAKAGSSITKHIANISDMLAK